MTMSCVVVVFHRLCIFIIIIMNVSVGPLIRCIDATHTQNRAAPDTLDWRGQVVLCCDYKIEVDCFFSYIYIHTNVPRTFCRLFYPCDDDACCHPIYGKQFFFLVTTILGKLHLVSCSSLVMSLLFQANNSTFFKFRHNMFKPVNGVGHLGHMQSFQQNKEIDATCCCGFLWRPRHIIEKYQYWTPTQVWRFCPLLSLMENVSMHHTTGQN